MNSFIKLAYNMLPLILASKAGQVMDYLQQGLILFKFGYSNTLLFKSYLALAYCW